MYAAALGISPKTKIHNYSSPTRSPKLTERKSFTFKFRLLTLSISITYENLTINPRKMKFFEILGYFYMISMRADRSEKNWLSEYCMNIINLWYLTLSTRKTFKLYPLELVSKHACLMPLCTMYTLSCDVKKRIDFRYKTKYLHIFKKSNGRWYLNWIMDLAYTKLQTNQKSWFN